MGTAFTGWSGRPALALAAVGFCLAFFSPSPGSADPLRPDALRAGDPGQLVDLAAGRGIAEMLSFDATLAPSLLALKTGEGREIADFPTAPGVRHRVNLVRREIYAPNARIYRVDGSFRTEIPRSRLVFFSGTDLEGAGNRLSVAVDPDTLGFSGFVQGPDGVNEISRESSGGRRHVLARPVVPDGATWTCEQEDTVETSVSWAPPASTRSALATVHAEVLTSPYSAVVAIDTDNEYMAYWSNNTTNVTNYIAQLIGNINIMYQRDLNLTLVQGTTFLRVSTTPDPYNVNDNSNADSNELSEFTNYWNTNYPLASYPRSVVTMMSGKQPDTNSASGIAWVAGSTCGTSYDYNFCQLFKTSYLWGDTLIMGHEIGHNLGSPHTHCYADPKPDICWGTETTYPTCYSGPGVCPAVQTINGVTNVYGTLMGYCHLLGGCSSSLVFHPSTISRYVGPTLDAGASSACIAPLVVGPPPPPTSTSLNPLTPCRILDTRTTPNGELAGPALVAGATRLFTVTGTCGIPTSAVSISANLTVVSTASGQLTVYPGNAANPGTSSLSFDAGQVRANNAILFLATDGTGGVNVANTSAGANNLIIDVNGYFK